MQNTQKSSVWDWHLSREAAALLFFLLWKRFSVLIFCLRTNWKKQTSVHVCWIPSLDHWLVASLQVGTRRSPAITTSVQTGDIKSYQAWPCSQWENPGGFLGSQLEEMSLQNDITWKWCHWVTGVVLHSSSFGMKLYGFVAQFLPCDDGDARALLLEKEVPELQRGKWRKNIWHSFKQ